jgi:hypothetical protein
MRYALFFIVLLSILGCSDESQESANSPTAIIQQQAEAFFKFSPDTQISVIPSTDTPGSFNVEVMYPVPNFDPSQGTKAYTNNYASKLQTFFNLDQNLDKVKIFMVTAEGEKIGTLETSKQDFIDAARSGMDIYSYTSRNLELNRKFLVETRLTGISSEAQNIQIERGFNESRNTTALKVSFELKVDKYKPEWQKSATDDISLFENLVSSIVKTVFETDTDVDEVLVVAVKADEDDRWNQSSIIATYSMERGEFEEIVEKWDDLRYKIYDDIEYTPIYLMDYAATSNLVSMDYNKTTYISMYYDKDFETIDKTIDLITADAESMIVNIFENYELVNDIEIDFKVKVPAREGEISSDGIHSIIEDFVIIRAQRAVFDGLRTDELTPIQTIYNFDMEWHPRGPDLMIRSNLFQSSDFYRQIEFSSGMSEAEITLDSCIFQHDKYIKPRIAGIRRMIAQGSQYSSLEDEIYNIIAEYAKKLIFDIHPPFLDTVTINIERVYLDTTGNEIDVTELGYVVFEKQDEANYWFQTEDPEDLEWIIELEDEIDIDDDEVLCQT